MSADLLRRAASLIRERAEGASAQLAEIVDPITLRFGSDVDPRCVFHYFSWHPTVALAVADWLDVVAGYGEPQPGRGTRNWTAALDVARAYLGESA